MIIFTGSAQHTSINFGQFGFSPVFPPLFDSLHPLEREGVATYITLAPSGTPDQLGRGDSYLEIYR